jgi:membrane protease YdiL (CAAX protease family)
MTVLSPWRTLGVAAIWVALSVGLSFAVMVLLGAAVSALTAPNPTLPWWQRPDPVTAVLAAGYISQATLLAGAMRRGWLTGKGDIEAGLGAGPIRNAMLVPLLALTAVVAAAVLLAIVRHVPWLHRAAEGLSMPFLQTLKDAGPVRKLVTVVFVAALAPIAEELFFRGWLWTALLRFWNPGVVAVVTGAFWLLLHAPDGLIRPLMLLPMAAILSASRYWNGSVQGPVMLHIFNNALAVSLLMSAR